MTGPLAKCAILGSDCASVHALSGGEKVLGAGILVLIGLLVMVATWMLLDSAVTRHALAHRFRKSRRCGRCNTIEFAAADDRAFALSRLHSPISQETERAQ